MPTMLVVDDDAAWRALYRLELGETFEIVEATDGAHALALLADLRPDVILVDLRMPRMDGPTFLKELDRRWAGAPVVIASAMLPEDGRTPISGARLASKSPDLREVRDAIREVAPQCFRRPPAAPGSADEPRWLD
jgi:CheY-like chemotaxis protein